MKAFSQFFCIAAISALAVQAPANARCRSVAIRVDGSLAAPLGTRELLVQAVPDPRGASKTTITVDGTRFVGELRFDSGTGSDGVGGDCSGDPQIVTLSLVSGERRADVARLAFPKAFRSTKGIWIARIPIQVNPDLDLAIQ
jgi:hypothetical protein